MDFKTLFDQYHWQDVKESIYSKTSLDVEGALYKNGKRNLEDFKSLLSPSALPYLENIAILSQELTQKRFGKTIQMYIPLYLSNECQNICTYCGFSLDNKIKRITLNDKQILEEVKILKSYGYDHILLLTGEHQNLGLAYFKKVFDLIQPYFSSISIEVQPLEEEEYKELIAIGLNAVMVYQETYHQENYKKHHPKGKKSNFYHRLETPDRLGKAGINKIGIGTLIGLEDWRIDSFFTALHLSYLEKTYWKTRYSISFPRLRPTEKHPVPATPNMFNSTVAMSDRELVQLICAFRIFDEEVELSISTRENEKFRDHIIQMGITSMSAGSKTNPGGYALTQESLEQFEIIDERSAKEIEVIIKSKGYEAVWKDWDKWMVKV